MRVGGGEDPRGHRALGLVEHRQLVRLEHPAGQLAASRAEQVSTIPVEAERPGPTRRGPRRPGPVRRRSARAARPPVATATASPSSLSNSSFRGIATSACDDRFGLVRLGELAPPASCRRPSRAPWGRRRRSTRAACRSRWARARVPRSAARTGSPRGRARTRSRRRRSRPARTARRGPSASRRSRDEEHVVLARLVVARLAAVDARSLPQLADELDHVDRLRAAHDDVVAAAVDRVARADDHRAGVARVAVDLQPAHHARAEHVAVGEPALGDRVVNRSPGGRPR